MTSVAINGLGRIGRAALRIIGETPELELAAVNDLADIDNLAYLLRHDTAYGRYGPSVEVEEGQLIIEGKRIPSFAEKNPSDLPWSKAGVDLVFECTGVFRHREDLQGHLDAGASHVILSAPPKGDDIPSVVYAVSEPRDEAPPVVSTASCTTNCIAPVAEVLDRRIGVRKALMTTVHAYTSSQAIVDGPSGKWERGRAGAANLIPTSTGAAQATGTVLPQYRDRFDGLAVRAPVPVGSLVDLCLLTRRETTREEINEFLREESVGERYAGVLGCTDEPLVSSDIVGDPRASVVDLTQTRVVDGDLVKVIAWYDNEWGYASQMIREAVRIGTHGRA